MDMSAIGDVGASAGLAAGAGIEHACAVSHVYHVECWREGALVWAEDFKNLVTTVGKNKYLDATLKTGLASPAWYVGLVVGPGGSNTYAAADTMASHAGWTESVVYSDATRQAFTPGAVSAGSVDNSASKAVFNINAGGTVGGAFMVDNSTKSGGTGVLLGVGSFASDRTVISGDTLNVTITATMA